LEKEMGKTGFEALLKSDPMQVVAERCNYHSVDDLLAGLGYGEVTLNLVLNRWREVVKAQQPLPAAPEVLSMSATAKPLRETPLAPKSRASESPIAGVEGLLYHLAKCCHPIPGESIIGVVTTRSNRGISIHRQGCQNVESIPCDRLVPVSWNSTESARMRPQTYPVNVQIEAIDRVGVLKDILSRLSDQGINVRNAQVKTANGQPAIIELGLDIRDRAQLEHVFSQIKKLSDIIDLRRVGEVDE
jgi:(p)ppGpp synthase/HD superfamily hydrolase